MNEYQEIKAQRKVLEEQQACSSSSQTTSKSGEVDEQPSPEVGASADTTAPATLDFQKSSDKNRFKLKRTCS